MKSEFHYEQGAVRWRRHLGDGDVRGYRAKSGWSVQAHLVDFHPISAKQLPRSEWWIREQYVG